MEEYIPVEFVSYINLGKSNFIQKRRKIILPFLPIRECFSSPAWDCKWAVSKIQQGRLIECEI